jgi:hypothetical protein
MADEKCTYKQFLMLYPYADKGVQEDLVLRLKDQPRPAKLCGKDVPQDLNALSYGTLDDIRSAADAKDIVGECAKILLGIEPDQLFDEDVNDVFGFLNFVTKELERINKLFASIKVNYSKEEIAAGIKTLDFGSFGVLDWYAKRMGITNQNEVREVAWVRIYRCMYNDAMSNNYERKLSQQYMKKK